MRTSVKQCIRPICLKCVARHLRGCWWRIWHLIFPKSIWWPSIAHAQTRKIIHPSNRPEMCYPGFSSLLMANINWIPQCHAGYRMFRMCILVEVLSAGSSADRAADQRPINQPINRPIIFNTDRLITRRLIGRSIGRLSGKKWRERCIQLVIYSLN